MSNEPYDPIVPSAHYPNAPQTLSDHASVKEMSQLILTEMQQDIDARIEWRLSKQGSGRRDLTSSELGMALGSLAMAIPLSVIALIWASFPGLALVWVGIVLVNLAWSVRR